MRVAYGSQLFGIAAVSLLRAIARRHYLDRVMTGRPLRPGWNTRSQLT